MADHICNTGEAGRTLRNLELEEDDEAKDEEVFKDPVVEAVQKRRTRPRETTDSAERELKQLSMCFLCQGKIDGHIMHVVVEAQED